MIAINKIRTDSEMFQLNELLWEVLWKPLDLPRNIRESFKLEGKSLEFIARSEGALVGGLVANWTSECDVEIRHIAIKPENQKQGIGIQLIDALLKRISNKSCVRVHTIARNTSAPFFEKLGFKIASGTTPEHPLFKRRGITFELMERNVEQGTAADADKPKALQNI
jgi:N-acetylglutamate synthase-like GNAT family acetyltransferase